MASGRIKYLLSRSLGSNSCLKGGPSKYSTAAAIDDPVNPPVKVKYTQLLINGNFVDAASGPNFYCLTATNNFRNSHRVNLNRSMSVCRVPGKTFETMDPRTGEVIASVAEGDAEDIDRAVTAARKAFDEGPWPKMTAYERSKILLRCADLLEQHNDELAALETWDSGKPYEQAAKVEVPMLVRLLGYYAGWADKIHGLTVPADGPYHVQTLHEPIGVAGQIIPWNFPLLMYAWKVGPALACGNTIVLKTALLAPLSALYAANLLHEAGLPPGVLNVVSGHGKTAGAALCSHMDVDKLAFTGSTSTGKVVLGLAAKSNLEPVTLGLGGKSPFIICEDAEVDKAVELAHSALFFNQATHIILFQVMFCVQVLTDEFLCFRGNAVVLVHAHMYMNVCIYDEFVEKAKARAAQRSVGDPFKQGIEQGPQIDPRQFERILGYIKSGMEDGATLETGGDRFGTKGYYIKPTVFSNVTDDMLIAKDEIFGPVQSILKFKSLDEVIQRSNATNYGLAAGVFTQNTATANTLARALRVGIVWINCYDGFDAAIPCGGCKMSGHGREKGIYSLRNYLQVKVVVAPLKNPAWL